MRSWHLDPLPITDMYRYIGEDGRLEDVPVQLADGGLFDNLGVWPLIDEGAVPIIISDASGQLESDLDPAPGATAVLLRSFDVLMARSRDALITALQHAYPTGITLIHLREGLASRVIRPSTEQTMEPELAIPSDPPAEAFGVDSVVQDRLSRVRTDLDSFTEVEAYSLMLDGYLISGKELREIKNSP